MKKNKSTRVNPKKVGRPPKIGVEKGFGPRHGANAKEGEEVDLTKIPSDSVPAMLTPREAVLNRNAAELAGRDQIEALNEEGNALAKKGVDLAAEGDEDVTPYPERLPLEGAQVPQAEAGERNAAMLDDLEEALRRRGLPPLRALMGEDFDPKDVPIVPAPGAGQRVFDPRYSGQDRYTLAQKGTSDMKSKPKQYQGGKNYVGGYKEGPPIQPPTQNPPLGSGGATNWMQPAGGGTSMPGFGGPGLNSGSVPGNTGGGGWSPAGVDTGGTGGGLEAQWARTHRGAMPANYGSAQWAANHPNFINSTGGGVSPMPGYAGGPIPLPQNPGVSPGGKTNKLGSGSFYPPGQGFAAGTSGVEEILGGGESIYGNAAPVNLSAPSGLGELVKAIQAEAQKQGLSASQIQGILGAFKGMGGGAGSQSDMMTAASVGAQAGISDIGYAPFVAPGAQFHADKGGWLGPLDPLYTYNGYARGTGSVPGLYRGENDFRGGGPSTAGFGNRDYGGRTWNPNAFPPDLPAPNMDDPADRFSGGNPFGPDLRMSWMGGGRLGYQPPPWAAGFSQGPTMIPTTLGNSGYPMAVPASSDWDKGGARARTPMKNRG